MRTIPFAFTAAGTTKFDFLIYFSPLMGSSGLLVSGEVMLLYLKATKSHLISLAYCMAGREHPRNLMGCFHRQQLMLDIYREIVL